MDDRDISWIALVPLAILAGLAVLLAETGGLWPGRVVRPDLVWCLAFFAARRAAPTDALAASAWCGLARDMVLGPKLGSAILAYLLVAITHLHLRERIAGGGFIDYAALIGALAVAVNLARSAFDSGPGFLDAWADGAIAAAGCGLATLAAYPAMYALLSVSWFNPTRERRRSM